MYFFPSRLVFRAMVVGALCLAVTVTTPAFGQEKESANPEEAVSTFTGMKLRLIPAGTFLMGSSDADVRFAMKADNDSVVPKEYLKREQPQHRVRISKAYYMGVTEVTQGEYEKVMGTNPSYFSKTGGGKEKVKDLDTSQFPVEQVSWFDAIEFCNKLSAQDGLPTYYTMTKVQRAKGLIKSADVALNKSTSPRMTGYRLPTEAEWEYACRANTTTPYHFGSDLNGDKANINGNYPFGTTKGKNLERTTMVGSYAANAFGLSDMSGNVEEWCYDVYDEKAYTSRHGTTVDPVTAAGSKARVSRGTSFSGDALYARSAFRFGHAAGSLNYNNNGFRVAR